MRSAKASPLRAISARISPKPCWVDIRLSVLGWGRVAGIASAGASSLRLASRANGTAFRKASISAAGKRGAFELVPFMAFAHAIGGAERRHLRLGHQAGVIVLVALQRQAEAFHRIGDEDGGPFVVGAAFERLQQGRHVVAAQIGHQRGQFVVAAPRQKRAHRPLVAQLVGEPLAPGRAALEQQRGIKRIGRGIDPGAQAFAARFGERRLQQRAIFQNHHFPAKGAEQGFQPLRTGPRARWRPGSGGYSR